MLSYYLALLAILCTAALALREIDEAEQEKRTPLETMRFGKRDSIEDGLDEIESNVEELPILSRSDYSNFYTNRAVRSPLETMRFGKRSGDKALGTMRFGKRADPLNTMRFGKRAQSPFNTMRFGKRDPLGTMRFGRK